MISTPKGSKQPRISSVGTFDMEGIIYSSLLQSFIDFTTLGIKVEPITLSYWSKGSGQYFTTWEFVTLMEMNAGFLSQLKISSEPSCPSPLLTLKDRREKVVSGLATLLQRHSKDK